MNLVKRSKENEKSTDNSSSNLKRGDAEMKKREPKTVCQICKVPCKDTICPKCIAKGWVVNDSETPEYGPPID